MPEVFLRARRSGTRTRAWVVPAALHGESERWNLEHQQVTVGRGEVGGLGPRPAEHEVNDRLERTFTGIPLADLATMPASTGHSAAPSRVAP